MSYLTVFSSTMIFRSSNNPIIDVPFRLLSRFKVFHLIDVHYRVFPFTITFRRQFNYVLFWKSLDLPNSVLYWQMTLAGDVPVQRRSLEVVLKLLSVLCPFLCAIRKYLTWVDRLTGVWLNRSTNHCCFVSLQRECKVRVDVKQPTSLLTRVPACLQPA